MQSTSRLKEPSKRNPVQKPSNRAGGLTQHAGSDPNQGGSHRYNGREDRAGRLADPAEDGDTVKPNHPISRPTNPSQSGVLTAAQGSHDTSHVNAARHPLAQGLTTRTTQSQSRHLINDGQKSEKHTHDAKSSSAQDAINILEQLALSALQGGDQEGALHFAIAAQITAWTQGGQAKQVRSALKTHPPDEIKDVYMDRLENVRRLASRPSLVVPSALTGPRTLSNVDTRNTLHRLDTIQQPAAKSETPSRHVDRRNHDEYERSDDSISDEEEEHHHGNYNRLTDNTSNKDHVEHQQSRHRPPRQANPRLVENEEGGNEVPDSRHPPRLVRASESASASYSYKAPPGPRTSAVSHSSSGSAPRYVPITDSYAQKLADQASLSPDASSRSRGNSKASMTAWDTDNRHAPNKKGEMQSTTKRDSFG